MYPLPFAIVIGFLLLSSVLQKTKKTCFGAVIVRAGTFPRFKFFSSFRLAGSGLRSVYKFCKIPFDFLNFSTQLSRRYVFVRPYPLSSYFSRRLSQIVKFFSSSKFMCHSKKFILYAKCIFNIFDAFIVISISFRIKLKSYIFPEMSVNVINLLFFLIFRISYSPPHRTLFTPP